MTHTTFPLVAVDIGNTRLKLGLFAEPPGDPPGQLPAPERTLDVRDEQFEAIADWLDPHDVSQVGWWIGSVWRAMTTEFVDWLRRREAVGPIVLLCCEDLPLTVDLPRPDMAGIDRLLAAVAANHLREPTRPAIVVDLGTAVTVDLISSEGAFQGGAILPGIAMSARALHEFTDLLPRFEMKELHDPPPVVGQDTIAAMRSGLFWGTVGAARELAARMSPDGTQTQVFLTGGAAPSVADLLASDARFEPDLTLSGIALTAASHSP